MKLRIDTMGGSIKEKKKKKKERGGEEWAEERNGRMKKGCVCKFWWSLNAVSSVHAVNDEAAPKIESRE